MYLQNTVGKRHKKRSNSFSATEIYGFEIALSFRCAVHSEMTYKVNVRKIGSNFKRIDMRNCLNLSVTCKDQSSIDRTAVDCE